MKYDKDILYFNYSKKLILIFKLVLKINGFCLSFDKLIFVLRSKYDLYFKIISSPELVTYNTIGVPFRPFYNNGIADYFKNLLSTIYCFIKIQRYFFNFHFIQYFFLYYKLKNKKICSFLNFQYLIYFCNQYIKGQNSIDIESYFSNKLPVDDLNIPLNYRLYISLNYNLKDIKYSIHGGGSYIYINKHDIFLKSNTILFRKDLFYGFKKMSTLVSNKESNNNIISFAPYWFTNQRTVFQGQQFLSTNDQLSFINKLTIKYLNYKILIRDPSKFILKYNLVNNKHILDVTSKDQKIYKSGSLWSSDFHNSKIIYVSAFLTLGLQLLFADKPCIVLVNKKNLYPHLKSCSEQLFNDGVFVEKFEDCILFNDDIEIKNWWLSSQTTRKIFLKNYIDGITKHFHINKIIYV